MVLGPKPVSPKGRGLAGVWTTFTVTSYQSGVNERLVLSLSRSSLLVGWWLVYYYLKQRETINHGSSSGNSSGSPRLAWRRLVAEATPIRSGEVPLD